MKTETLDYWVLSVFACHIEYGDADTLTEDEISQFEELETQARGFFSRDGLKFMHWSISDETDEFRKCEATDIMGNCVKITAVYRG